MNEFSKLATVLLAIYGKHMLVTPLKQPYMYSPKVLQDFQVQPLAEKRNVFFIFFCIQTFKMRQRRFGTPKVAVAWALLLASRQELQLPAQPVATHKVPT